MPAVAPPEFPAGFARAVAALQSARVRPEVTLSEVPAPQRLAPYAVALAGEVRVHDTEASTGRLVLLHDPAGQEAWEGTTRLVAYVRAKLDAEMGADPLLPAVGWSWLVDSLSAAGAEYRAPAGTVSRVASERFGALSSEPNVAEMELRASWSPADEEDLAAHLCGFAELLCCAGGLPPTPDGVVAIPTRRGRPATGRPRAARRG